MKQIGIFITCCFLLVLTACNQIGSQNNALVASSGRSGEIVVLCTDAIWQSELGDSLRAVISQPLLQLPQPEPMFDLLHVNEQDFTGSYKKQRNILQVAIDSSFNSSKVTAKYNIWAEPQLVIRIVAKSMQDAKEQLSTNAQTIINYFLRIEFQRFEKAQKSRQDFRLHSIIKKNYKIDMLTPEGFFFAVQNENFAWLRKETKDWGQNLMIFIENYTDTNQFSNDYIIHLRDKMTKKYVFGSVDSSYVIVEKKLPHESFVLSGQNNYTVKTEGIWKTVGDFMGGGFVSYTFLDIQQNRVITLDGFLYAPNDKKRDLLRQLETILSAATLVENHQIEEK